MSEVIVRKDGIRMTSWEKFRGKSQRVHALRCKDYKGRVQENMVLLQRLTKFHPYGYKLRQVCSAIDIMRVTKRGFPNGCYSYRLHTYDNENQALPMRDYSQFVFPRHERKYVSYKFIGTVITMDKVITEGKVNEMS